MKCNNEEEIFVSHRVHMRSSIAFAPLQNEGGKAILAPLGTIWGDGPWHAGRRTGGQGMGEMGAQVIGSQFRPAAPDWSGKSISYRLLVGENLTPEVLDLFAHPPMLIVGSSE